MTKFIKLRIDKMHEAGYTDWVYFPTKKSLVKFMTHFSEKVIV